MTPRGAECLRVGDFVTVHEDAPLTLPSWAYPGTLGRVVLADVLGDRDARGEAAVQFGSHRPLRIHCRWLELITRPAR